MDLSSYQLSESLKKFPEFELSYETIQHKKVCVNYDLCMAIPSGKKYFIWHTFHRNLDVCYLLEISKQKEIVKGTCISNSGNYKFSLGTVIYGTLLEDTNVFICEEVYYYKGINLKKLFSKEKLYILKEIVEKSNELRYNKKELQFYLPNMWKNQQNEITNKITKDISEKIKYEIHHIQYRSLNEFLPFINIPLNQKITANVTKEKIENTKVYRTYTCDFKRTQYNYSAVFMVFADIEFDIYRLYAFGRNSSSVYYNIAYIPNYEKSVFMNGLFRKIRENENLDYIEESEDEEDFENVNVDKFVDLKKSIPMECTFNRKFKKWVPVKVANKYEKIVHINKLVLDYYQ